MLVAVDRKNRFEGTKTKVNGRHKSTACELVCRARVLAKTEKINRKNGFSSKAAGARGRDVCKDLFLNGSSLGPVLRLGSLSNTGSSECMCISVSASVKRDLVRTKVNKMNVLVS